MNFIGELFLAKVISSKVIDIINRTKLDNFVNDYQNFKLLKDSEFKNYQDHLEGLLILNNKVGRHMESRYLKEQ